MCVVVVVFFSLKKENKQIELIFFICYLKAATSIYLKVLKFSI